MAHAWKACWVQALGGSNPPSSATGPRDRFRFRGFCCLWRRVLLLVVPLVFWAPSGPAAREIATRELRSEWSISKPARALRTLRRPPHRRHCVAWTSPARPRHRPPAPRPGPPDPPAPSTPAALVSLGLAWPGPAAAHRHRGQAMQSSPPRLAGSVAAGNRAFIARLCSGLVALRLRGPRRFLRPGARPGLRLSQRASIGAGPSRCSSIRPSMPSR